MPPWFCAVACPFREGTTPGSIPALTAFITIIIKGFAEAGWLVSCRGVSGITQSGPLAFGSHTAEKPDFTRSSLPRGVRVRALRRPQGFSSTEGIQTSPNPLSYARSACPSDPLPSDAPYSSYQEKDTRDSETPLTVWKSGVIFRGFQGPTEMGLILKVPQEEGGQKGWRRLPGKATKPKGAERGNEVGGCSWEASDSLARVKIHWGVAGFYF